MSALRLDGWRQRVLAAWALRRAQWFALVRALGVPALAGVGAAALAAALSLVAWAIERDRMRIEQVAQAATVRAALAQRPVSSSAIDDPVAALQRQVPAVDAMPAFLDSVYGGATRAGLRIERTEYPPRTLTGGVHRLRLVLPVQGTYPQLRRWLQQLLAEHPSVAVDELRIGRDGDEIEARVQLSYYWRAP